MRVRESVEDGDRRLALIATFVADSGWVRIFNPLGLHGAGRPYKIVLTSTDYRVLHTVSGDSSAVAVSQNSGTWRLMREGAIAGRCFWTRKRAADQPAASEDLAELPQVPAGRYFLVLLVSKRATHSPPPAEWVDYETQKQWLTHWNDPSLDESAYASPPAVLEVDAEGKYRAVAPAGTTTQFNMLDSEYRLDAQNQLSVTTRFVNPHTAQYAILGMSLYGYRGKPGLLQVVRKDGTPFDRFPFPGSSSGPSLNRSTDSIVVPKDCVLGGIDTAAGILPPGQYKVTSTISQSIFATGLDHEGRRVQAVSGKWPVAFQSPETVITVPEAPQ